MPYGCVFTLVWFLFCDMRSVYNFQFSTLQLKEKMKVRVSLHNLYLCVFIQYESLQQAMVKHFSLFQLVLEHVPIF